MNERFKEIKEELTPIKVEEKETIISETIFDDIRISNRKY